MPPTIRPIIVTNDIERLLGFYTSLLGAEENFRYPEDGPVFYLGLRLGDSELGLSSDSGVVPGDPGRMLLTVAGLGGSAPGPANDMPWGQRVAHIKDPDGNVVNLTQQL